MKITVKHHNSDINPWVFDYPTARNVSLQVEDDLVKRIEITFQNEGVLGRTILEGVSIRPRDISFE